MTCTVVCHSESFPYIILHTPLQWQQQNIIQTLNLQNTPHISPSQTSYEVPVVKIWGKKHYNDIIMGSMPSQFTSLTIVYSKVDSGADQRKHQSSASLAFVRGIHRWPVNSPHKWPVTRKMFPFDDVIMNWSYYNGSILSELWTVCKWPK